MKTVPPKLYLVPGLGADARLMAGLREEGLEFEVLEHIPPLPRESMKDYARRMVAGINTQQPFILGGVSLGGIMSVEMARHLQPEKVLLISSVKSSREIPIYFKLFRYLPLHRLVSGTTLKKYAPKDSRKGFPPHKYQLLEDMRTDASPELIEWAVDAVINWKNRQAPENLVHIHGSRDLMFPPFFLNSYISIPKGRHVMVLAKADKVAAEIKKHLYPA